MTSPTCPEFGLWDRRAEHALPPTARRDFIQDLGVPASAVLLEPDSRTTRENARFTARLLRQHQIGSVPLWVASILLPDAGALEGGGRAFKS